MQVTRGVAPRSHAFPPDITPPTVYATAKSFQPHTEESENGIRVILVPDQRWARCDIKTIGSGAPGAITRKLQMAFEEKK